MLTTWEELEKEKDNLLRDEVQDNLLRDEVRRRRVSVWSGDGNIHFSINFTYSHCFLSMHPDITRTRTIN